MIFNLPTIDSTVMSDLRAFIVVLSHLPVEVQLDVLRDATEQLTEVLNQS